MLSLQPGVQVIGVGNPLRGDDGVGPTIVEALKVQELPGTQLITCNGDDLTLIETWKTASAVILNRCRDIRMSPGTVYRFDALRQALPASFSPILPPLLFSPAANAKISMHPIGLLFP